MFPDDAFIIHSIKSHRFSSSCRRIHAWGIQDVRDPLADVSRLPTSRLSGCVEFGIISLHTSSDYPGEELRNHARHAPKQTTLAKACWIHHDMRMDVRDSDGGASPLQRFRLPEVRRVSTVRDEQYGQLDVRSVSHVHQRRSVSDTDGVLFEDVLCHKGFASVELERFANRKADGVVGVHRFLVLVANCVLLFNRGVRFASDHARTSQGVYSVRVTIKLML